jgi:hypothetical protein
MVARLLMTTLGLFCLMSCDASVPDDDRLQPSRLIVSHAEEDADTALARGDAGLLGVFGYSREAPGAPEGTAYKAGGCKVRMIEGTSDDGSRALNDRAREYARRYNLRIISRGGCSIMGGG